MTNNEPIVFAKDRPYFRSEIKPIKTRSCFQVGHNLYRTRETAAKKMAWSWIFTKYGGMKNTQSPSIEGIKKLYGMVCECDDKDVDEYGDVYGYPSDGCAIHDRKTGYFRRLHKRVAANILRSWADKELMVVIEKLYGTAIEKDTK